MFWKLFLCDLFKDKQLVLWKLFLLFICLVKEWFYSENIGGIIYDSLLEENLAIVIYLRNGEWTHAPEHAA